MMKSIWNQNATLIWSKFAYHLIKKQNGIDFADFEYLSFQIEISIKALMKSIWIQDATLIRSEFAYHLVKNQNGRDCADFDLFIISNWNFY